MKSDNSRNTFDPRKRYSGVIMQQGRVQLDADWNEQLAIQQHRTETEASDVIGLCGVPEKGGGFDINFTPDYSDLTISTGRMYVDGLLCENMVESHVPFKFVGTNQIQVDSMIVDGRKFRKGEWVELPHGDGHRDSMFQIVAVDADKQLLTLRVDDSLFKLSDHQQVKAPHLRRIMTYTTQPDYPYPDFAIRTSDAELSQLQLRADHYALLLYLDIWERHITALDDPAIREVALGGPDTTTRIQNVAQVRILPIQIDQEFQRVLEERKATSKKQEKAALDEDINRFARSLTGNSEFPEWAERIRPSTGRLEVRLQPTPPGIPAYQRLENQLYRVEIHSVNDPKGGTRFKWSRDNGSAATAIKEIKGNTVIVQGVGPNSILDFQRGQWVEITSDLNELKSQPGHGTKISDVDHVSGALVLEESPPVIDPRWHPKLLRWDGGEAFQPGGDWFELEGGIEIRFPEGSYKPGDYWQIPARTATGTVEWPYTLPQPARGVRHHYARLGLVHLYQEQPEVQDCRRWFPPIASHAMHVLDTNWSNDEQYPRDFLKEGLRITLDTAPEPYSISAATLIVSVETSLPGGGDGLFIMNGSITVQDNNISWQWRGREEGSIAEFLDKINILRRGHSLRPLVRVTLKGHHIWGSHDGRLIYLDGQTYSEPGVFLDKTEQREHRNALKFPSGGGAKAHDFESWFYLADILQ
ncbi:MAG: hypothetical protein NVS4B11_00540 [Ktedonobacteraceae bacterium]